MYGIVEWLYCPPKVNITLYVHYISIKCNKTPKKKNKGFTVEYKALSISTPIWIKTLVSLYILNQLLPSICKTLLLHGTTRTWSLPSWSQCCSVIVKVQAIPFTLCWPTFSPYHYHAAPAVRSRLLIFFFHSWHNWVSVINADVTGFNNFNPSLLATEWLLDFLSFLQCSEWLLEDSFLLSV